MKKLLMAAFVVAIAVTSWSSFNSFDSNAEKQSLVKFSNVEAITKTELPELTVICQKPCGKCWERLIDGSCKFSGYMEDECC